MSGYSNSRQRRAVDDDDEQTNLPAPLKGIDDDEKMVIPTPLRDSELVNFHVYKKKPVDEQMVVPRRIFKKHEDGERIKNDKQMTRIALNTTDGVSVS